MKNKIVIILILIVIVSCSLCLSGIAFADDDFQIVNKYVYDYAEELVKCVEGGYIKEVIPIYDIYSNINSCCFTIYVKDNPYIYFILDNFYRENTSPIIEIGFGEYKFNKNDKVVNLNYIDYGKIDNNIIECNNERKSVSEYKNIAPNSLILYGQSRLSKNVSVYDGYMDTLNSDDFKKAIAMDHFFEFQPFIQTDLANTAQIAQGICGATTAMNVLKFYYQTEYLEGNLYGEDGTAWDYISTYHKLLSYQTSSNPYNIENQTNRKKALTSYVKDYSKLKVSITKYLINSWTFIYNDIKNGKLVDYRYSGNEGGHCVLVIGAFEMNNGYKYIYVADTWSRELRWLNYGYHDNISCMSIKIYE